MRIKVPIANQRSCECWINSPCLYQRRWREESVKNIDTDMLGCKEVKKEDRESEKLKIMFDMHALSIYLLGRSISFIYYFSLELEIHLTIFLNIFLCNIWCLSFHLFIISAWSWKFILPYFFIFFFATCDQYLNLRSNNQNYFESRHLALKYFRLLKGNFTYYSH